MPDEEKPMTPLALAWQWIIANGKETAGFVIVMIAAVYMFENIMVQAKEARTQQVETIKALTAQLDKAHADRMECWKHAEKAERLLEDIARSLKK